MDEHEVFDAYARLSGTNGEIAYLGQYGRVWVWDTQMTVSEYWLHLEKEMKKLNPNNIIKL